MAGKRQKNENDPRIDKIADFFSDYDIHKSHGRSIDLVKIRELGLKARNANEIKGLANLIRSLYNQYELWFDKTPFYKVFENAYGINWGRQSQLVSLQIPASTPPGSPQPIQPGPPERSG